jgi:hypothetical protein
MSLNEGGHMEAAYVDTSRSEIGAAAGRAWAELRAVCSAVFRALAANARDDALDRVLTTPSSPGFAALPRDQQDQLLDRGFRP